MDCAKEVPVKGRGGCMRGLQLVPVDKEMIHRESEITACLFSRISVVLSECLTSYCL